MGSIGQNALSSLTGNLPKAILCVRDMEIETQGTGKTALEIATSKAGDASKMANAAQKKLLESTRSVLSSGVGSATQGIDAALAGTGYLAMEVQYNPNSIHMDTQAGRQVSYQGGALGGEGNNQLVQVVQPVSTTMSFQLIFDDMNPRDAFMLENLAPTVGNAISGVSNFINERSGRGYSVQDQIDGLMSILTRPETRQVIFFWSRMCFRGEVTSVNSRYTMFNKSGNPIRGTADISIRQGDEPLFQYDATYWDKAFDKAFGSRDATGVISGAKSTFSKITNNNFLNLNL